MADRVIEIMEAMIPEFEDLRKRGLCSPAEVKALIKRRENAEYSMNRRQPARADFLTAIQLEMNLESLIKVRRKRMGMPRRGASDYAVRKRIHFVFDRWDTSNFRSRLIRHLESYVKVALDRFRTKPSMCLQLSLSCRFPLCTSFHSHTTLSIYRLQHRLRK